MFTSPRTSAHRIRRRAASEGLRSVVVSERGGFTLIEMLVTVSILLILTALTLGAFNNINSDRATLSANTVKNALDGARSRAIRSNQVRGVRFLTDPNDTRIVTSLAYVGAPDFDIGQCSIVFSAGSWVVTRTSGSGGTWDALKGTSPTEANLLEPGNRIEIPAFSGSWYSISQPLFNLTTESVNLTSHYTPSVFEGGLFVAVPATNVPYRLELSPAPLAEDPILLSSQTAIDLDGSQVPDAWRPVTNGVNDPYSSRMQILFSPRGEMLRSGSSDGILHFRIAYISDILQEKSLGGRPLQQGAISPVVFSDSEKDQKAVSVFLQTGSVLISAIDRTGDAGDNIAHNDPATTPFRFATRGKDSQ